LVSKPAFTARLIPNEQLQINRQTISAFVKFFILLSFSQNFPYLVPVAETNLFKNLYKKSLFLLLFGYRKTNKKGTGK